MTAFYVYPLSLELYEAFSENFPDLSRRNEEFQVENTRFYGWVDPPDFQNRRRMVLTPAEDEVYILARSGRADWDFVQWIAHNDIRMDPPLQIYLW